MTSNDETVGVKVPQVRLVALGREVLKVFGDDPTAEHLEQLRVQGAALHIQLEESERRKRFPALEAVCAEVADALGPDRTHVTSMGTLYDFTGAPELLRRWSEAHDDAQRVLDAQLPALPVAPGDWVRIGGHRFRVRSVHPRQRSASIERVGAGGRPIAGTSCRADALVPLAEDDLGDLPWPACPTPTPEAHARHNRITIQRVVEEAGLA